MKEFSEIAKSAHISNDAVVEYPIHCGPNSQIHGGCNVGQFTFINISSVLYPNVKIGRFGNDSNLLIVFYVQIMPDDLVMQLHRF